MSNSGSSASRCPGDGPHRARLLGDQQAVAAVVRRATATMGQAPKVDLNASAGLDLVVEHVAAGCHDPHEALHWPVAGVRDSMQLDHVLTVTEL